MPKYKSGDTARVGDVVKIIDPYMDMDKSFPDLIVRKVYYSEGELFIGFHHPIEGHSISRRIHRFQLISRGPKPKMRVIRD